MECPGKHLPEWKALVAKIGATRAYTAWLINGKEVPSVTSSIVTTLLKTLPAHNSPLQIFLLDRIESKLLTKMEVKVDNSMVDSGQVRYDDKGKPTVFVNTDILQDDTIHHEFAHIFIDSIGGTDSYAVNSIAKQLMDPDKEYTESDKRELVAIALGQRLKSLETKTKISALLDVLIEKIKKMFGLNVDELALLANTALKQDFNNTILPKESNIVRSQLNPEAAKLKAAGEQINIALKQDGTQDNYYINKITQDKTNRLTDTDNGYTTAFIPFSKKTTDPIEASADQLYAKAGENEAIFTGLMDERGKILETRAEYVLRHKQEKAASTLKGTVKHLLAQMATHATQSELDDYNKYKDQLDKLIEDNDIDMSNFKWIIEPFNKEENDTAKIADARGFLTPEEFPKVTTNLRRILSMYGIQLVDSKGVFDPLKHYNALTEHTVTCPELGYSGTMDLMLFDPTENGRHAVIDFKTGKGFNKMAKNDMFNQASQWLLKYGSSSRFDIKYDSKSMAKLQVALLMVLDKSQNPDHKFKGGLIIDLSNKNSGLQKDERARVEMRYYLSMIETALKDKRFIDLLRERTGKDIPYNVREVLLEKSPNLFNPSHYESSVSIDDAKTINEFASAVSPSGAVNEFQSSQLLEDILFTKLESTRRFIDYAEQNDMYKQWVGDDLTKYLDAKKQLIEYTRMLANLRVGKRGSISDIDAYVDESLGKWEFYFKSLTDIKHPLIQVLSDLYNDKSLEAGRSFNKLNIAFRDVSDRVHKEWATKHGKMYNRTIQNFTYSGDEATNVFDFATKMEYTKVPTGRERLIIAYSKDGSVGATKLTSPAHTTVGNYVVHKEDLEEFNSLTAVQKEWLTHANELSSRYFVGEQAYMNQKTASILDNSVVTPKTRMEQYNYTASQATSEYGRYFQYYEGWFPKVWQDQSELAFKYGQGTALAKVIGSSYFAGYLKMLTKKFTWVQMLTDYMIRTFEGSGIAENELPIKYLGSAHLEDSRNYSSNLYKAFAMFTKNMEHKIHLDPVYNYSKGVMDILGQTKKGSHSYFKNEQEYLNTMMPYLLTGVTNEQRDRANNTKSLKIEWGGKIYYVDPMRIVNNIRSWTSATMMFGKVFNGLGNFAQSFTMTSMESIKQSLIKNKAVTKWIGVDDPYISFTAKDMAFGLKEYQTLLKDFVTGDFRQNKLWLLAKDTLYLSHQEGVGLTKEEAIARNKHISNDLGYAIFSEGDAMMSYVTLAAQLNRVKNNKTNKSMYDSYTVDKGQLKWIGGIRGVTQSGYQNTTNSTTIEGLTSLEVKKLKFVYEAIQGGYRTSEKVYANAFWYGQLLMSMKQYLPRLVANMFESTKVRDELGGWKPVLNPDGTIKEVEKDGEKIPVYEWHGKLVEGRIRSILKAGMTVARYIADPSKGWKGFTDNTAQRENLIDAAVHISTIAALGLAYLAFFSGSGGDDKLKKWYKNYILQNPNQVYYLADLSKNMETFFTPVALKQLATKSYEALEFLADAFMIPFTELTEGNSGMLDDKGNIKHLESLLKIIPVYSGGRSVYDFIAKSELPEYNGIMRK